jgi:cytochrome b6-f complex iron-sulfur subunit
MVGGAIILILPTALTSCQKDDPDATGKDPSSGGGTPSTPGKITIDLTDTKYASLNNTGGFMVVQSVIIANIGGGTFVALSGICTHQGCEIAYNSAANNFPCPCHGSLFSSTGSVLNGPATEALKSYTISKTGNIITINL